MAGASIILRDEKVRELLGEVRRKLKNPQPLMKIWGNIIRTSVIRNFEVGGRPTKWASLSATTAMLRGATGPILRRQGFAGGLMGSINIQADKSQVRVGTNKIYGALHQFGARKGQFGTKAVTVRAHARKSCRGGRHTVRQHTRKMTMPWGDIPARPFLVFQEPADINEMKAATTDYLTGK